MNSTYAEDLRFALEVMEKHSCLGLDMKYAAELRSVLIRQIERAEADQARSPLREPSDLDLRARV